MIKEGDKVEYSSNSLRYGRRNPNQDGIVNRADTFNTNWFWVDWDDGISRVHHYSSLHIIKG